jgi:hypothetical protein
MSRSHARVTASLKDAAGPVTEMLDRVAASEAPAA